jgi:hypothetical protein
MAPPEDARAIQRPASPGRPVRSQQAPPSPQDFNSAHFAFFFCINHCGNRRFLIHCKKAIQKEPAMRHWIAAGLFLLVLGVKAAPAQQSSGSERSFDVSEEDGRKHLEGDLEDLKEVVSSMIVAGTSTIQRNTNDKAVRDRASNWEKFLLSRFDAAFKDAEPQVALADIWALTLQASDFLAKGGGKDFFGDQHAAAELAVRQVRKSVESLAGNYLPPASFAEVQKEAGEYARKNPMEFSTKSGNWIVQGVDEFHLSLKKGAKGVFGLLSVPLMPLSLAKDVHQGSEGIGDLSVTADRFTDVIDKMPERVREEIEFLFNQLEESEATIDGMLALLKDISANASETATQTGKAAETIQEPLRIAESLTPKIQQAAESLSATSAECAKLVEAIASLMEQAREGQSAGGAAEGGEFKIADYLETAEAIQTGAAEVRGLLDDINKMVEAGRQSSQDNPDRHSFDIREYTEAAESIKAATSELRWAFADLTSSSQTGTLKKTLETIEKTAQGSIESAQASATHITDHIAKRIAQLLILAFVLALAFILFKGWTGKRHQG